VDEAAFEEEVELAVKESHKSFASSHCKELMKSWSKLFGLLRPHGRSTLSIRIYFLSLILIQDR